MRIQEHGAESEDDEAALAEAKSVEPVGASKGSQKKAFVQAKVACAGGGGGGSGGGGGGGGGPAQPQQPPPRPNAQQPQRPQGSRPPKDRYGEFHCDALHF